MNKLQVNRKVSSLTNSKRCQFPRCNMNVDFEMGLNSHEYP